MENKSRCSSQTRHSIPHEAIMGVDMFIPALRRRQALAAQRPMLVGKSLLPVCVVRPPAKQHGMRRTIGDAWSDVVVMSVSWCLCVCVPSAYLAEWQPLFCGRPRFLHEIELAIGAGRRLLWRQRRGGQQHRSGAPAPCAGARHRVSASSAFGAPPGRHTSLAPSQEATVGPAAKVAPHCLGTSSPFSSLGVSRPIKIAPRSNSGQCRRQCVQTRPKVGQVLPSFADICFPASSDLLRHRRIGVEPCAWQPLDKASHQCQDSASSHSACSTHRSLHHGVDVHGVSLQLFGRERERSGEPRESASQQTTHPITSARRAAT